MKKQGVELYRFIMTVMVCLHHFRLYSEITLPFGGGYLAVDFFFMLSGYFLYNHSKKKENGHSTKVLQRTAEYAIDRYKRLLPQYVLVLLFSIAIYVCVLRVDINITQISAWVAKILMFDGIYVHTQLNIMPQGWYCSVLLIDSILIYFLCVRFGQKFTKKAALMLAVGIYAILFWRYGFLNLYTQFGFGVTVGGFRGFAGLCMGCALGSLRGGERKQGKKTGWIDAIVFLTSTSVICYALLWNTAHNKCDYAILLLFLVILFYLLGDNNISRFFDRYRLSGLGNISYNMYLIHHVIAVLFDHFNWFRSYDWKIASLVYLGVVVIGSLLFEKIISVIKAGRHSGRKNRRG